jgi:hypothetical protein
MRSLLRWLGLPEISDKMPTSLAVPQSTATVRLREKLLPVLVCGRSVGRDNMTSQQAQMQTLFFLAAISVLCIAYDVFIVRAAGPDASISRVLGRLLELPSAFVVFVFWLGVLVGHVWLPSR